MRLSLLPLVFLLATPLAAQKNWVVNGDFSNGLKGWTGSGPGNNPLVQNFMTDGLKASPAFAINAGDKIFKPPHAPYILKQSIFAIPGVTYEVVMDVAITGFHSNLQAGIFEIKFGGKSVAKRDFGRFVGGTTPRDRLCARFTLTKRGKSTFQVEISRPRFIFSSRTPRQFIDNIKLQIVSGPSFCIRGDRKLGGTNTWEVGGNPKALFVVFASPKLLPKPIAVPGYSGLFALDVATTLVVYSGALDANGVNLKRFTMPSLSVLDKLPLYFEALSIGPKGRIFGSWHNWGYHK
jgi:hypothetical protein